MIRRIRPLATLILAVSLSTAGDARSQSTEDQTPLSPPQSSPAPAARPISGAELASSVESARDRLQAMRGVAGADSDVTAVLADLPAVTRAVERRQVELAGMRLETSSIRRLDVIRQRWQLLGGKLGQMQGVLDRRSALIDQALDTLISMRQRWTSTQAEAVSENIPEQLLAQVDDLLSSIDELDRQIKDRRVTLLAQLGRITELRTTTDGVLSDVRSAQHSARRRIVEFDRPPLWRAIFVPRRPISLTQQIRDSWEQDREEFSNFLAVYGDRVPFQALLFVFWISVMLVLRRRSKGWVVAADDIALRNAVHIFARPLSAALAATLVFTRLFYPEAPVVVIKLNLLVALVPVLHLLPGMVYRGVRPALYALAALFTLQQFHSLAAEQTLLQRLVLLASSGLGLAGGIWLSRPRGVMASRKSGGKWWFATSWFVRLASLLFGTAVVANVIGAVNLAELVTDGTLRSAYGAVALFVCMLVFEALIVVALDSRAARATGMITRHGDLVRRRLIHFLRLLTAVLWFVATLWIFGIIQPVYGGLARLLGHAWTIGNLTFSIGSIVAFALTIYIATLLSRGIRFVLDEDVFPRLPLQRGVPSTISMLINYAVLSVGFLAAMAAAGFRVDQFAIVAGALGVGIGFGMQNIVNNFISGLILVFERPIKIGDTIEVGELIGNVRRIGIRSSTVRTYDGAEVIVPNGNLIAAEVVNWTLSDRTRRLKISVGVAYGTDPQRVMDILFAVAKKSQDVLSYPEPIALFRGFGESSLDFELRIWTSNFEGWPTVASNVTLAINRELVEAGIEIPFPQRDLHLRSVDNTAARSLGASSASERLESEGAEH